MIEILLTNDNPTADKSVAVTSQRRLMGADAGTAVPFSISTDFPGACEVRQSGRSSALTTRDAVGGLTQGLVHLHVDGNGVPNGRYYLFFLQNESQKEAQVVIDMMADLYCPLFDFPTVNRKDLTYTDMIYPIDCYFVMPDGYTATFQPWSPDYYPGNLQVSLDNGATWQDISRTVISAPGSYHVLLKPLGASPMGCFRIVFDSIEKTYVGMLNTAVPAHTVGDPITLYFFEDVKKSDITLDYFMQPGTIDFSFSWWSPDGTRHESGQLYVPMSVDLMYEIVACDDDKEWIAAGTVVRVAYGYRLVGGTWKGIDMFLPS